MSFLCKRMGDDPAAARSRSFCLSRAANNGGVVGVAAQHEAEVTNEDNQQSLQANADMVLISFTLTCHGSARQGDSACCCCSLLRTETAEREDTKAPRSWSI
jgi:hypothetical protein